METYSKNLGRTAFECKDLHISSISYKIGSIVYKTINDIVYSYISRKDVPKGINLDNDIYWQPISLTLEYN